MICSLASPYQFSVQLLVKIRLHVVHYYLPIVENTGQVNDKEWDEL